MCLVGAGRLRLSVRPLAVGTFGRGVAGAGRRAAPAVARCIVWWLQQLLKFRLLALFLLCIIAGIEGMFANPTFGAILSFVLVAFWTEEDCSVLCTLFLKLL